MRKIYISVFLCCLTILLFAQDQQKIDSLKLDLKLAVDADEKIDLLLALTNQLINNTPDEALKYATQAYNLASENNYDLKAVRSLNRMSKIYRIKVDSKKAMDYAVTAYTIAEENDFYIEMIESSLNIGFVYNHLGDYEKSSKYFFRSLKLSEEIANKNLIANSLNSIGYSYFDQNNFDKAIEYYLHSLAIAQEINNIKGISAGLNNVAAVYGAMGDRASLKPYVLEAIKINKEIGQVNSLTINYMNMGYYFKETGNSDSSLYYYTKALDLADKMGNIALVLDIRLNLAGHLYESGNIDESLRETHEILRQSEEKGLKKITFDAAKFLVKIYQGKEDYKNAFHYNTLRYEMKDSLDLDDQLTELSKLELLYEFEKSEQELKIKQKRNEYIFLIVGITLVSILGFVLLLLKRHRMKARISDLEKQKLEDELEFKNKELAANVMSLMKKNEMLSTFSSRLLEVEKEAVKDETKFAILKISKELKKSVELKIWEEFALRFKEVHTDFYYQLMETYPNLSPSEQRLCAFLRLNLSTKEISELTGQTTRAIEMARFRLRKKLNISGTEDNLVTFLSQI